MVHIRNALIPATIVAFKHQMHRISLEILIITRIIFCDVEFCLECMTHAMRPMSIVCSNSSFGLAVDFQAEEKCLFS